MKKSNIVLKFEKKLNGLKNIYKTSLTSWINKKKIIWKILQKNEIKPYSLGLGGPSGQKLKVYVNV